MRYAGLTERISGQGAAAWDIHVRALAAQARDEDVVVMSVGDPDFATPLPVVESAVAALRGGDTHYTPPRGREPLLAAIAEAQARRTGLRASAANVVVAAGCQNALFATAQVLLDPGDEALVLEPTYVTYEATLRAPGAVLVPVPCPAERGFRPDPEALRAAVGDRTRAIFLANPVNPTGAVLTPGDLAAIAETARAHDLWVVADEVYAGLVFEGEHRSIAALPGMAERAVTLGSLSKSHAMTGWRCGWAIGPEAFAAHLDRLNLCMTYGLPGFVQEAALKALEGDQEPTETMRTAYRRRRDRACSLLGDLPGLRPHLPPAGMFMMIDVRATGLSGGTFSSRLFEEEGVSVLDGAAFGRSTEGWVRLSFAVADEDLERGCARIARFARRLGETT